MKAPAAFKTVCRNFIQDYELVASTPEGLIDFAIGSLASRDIRVIHAFLDEVVSGSLSEQELQQLWLSTPAEIHLSDGKQVLAFLTLMKSRIARRIGLD